MKNHQSSSPPLARLTLRIGITGHRPNNLHSADPETLRLQVKRVLEFLKNTVAEIQLKAGSLYLNEPPLLRVISPLAEGSDRLVAEVANTCGPQFDLQSVLPFSQAEYEQDFRDAESLKQFRELLKKANSVLELEGTRGTAHHDDRAYETLGGIVLNHSDVMIAIWNGQPGQRGGTSQTVSNAEALNIPLLWIDSKTPHEIRVKLKHGKEWIPWETAHASLSETLKKLLLPPPRATDKKQKPDLLHAYFKETGRRWIFASFWKLFRRLVVKVPPPLITTPPSASLPKDISEQIENALGQHYSWADKLAEYYANVYRSAFVFNYVMSALAVLFAFVGYAFREHETIHVVFPVVEVIIILSIILVTFLGIRYRWHERWIDYRLLAEYLRQTQALMALGRASVSVFRVPIHLSYGDPRASWMYWYLQTIVRHSGIMRVKFDGDYLKTVSRFLDESVKDQIVYHQRNAKISQKLNDRLRNVGLGLFFLAAAAAVFHLFLPEEWLRLLTTLTIVGPSFGAAAAAIRSQGEFERLTKSSRAMSSQLTSVCEKVRSLNPNDLSSVKLTQLAVESAQLMVKDVLNWRLVVEEKPLDLPA
jgi:hypothetical protein